jgi:hypothetical protein
LRITTSGGKFLACLIGQLPDKDGLLRYRTKIFNTEYNSLSIHFRPNARRSHALAAAKSRTPR